MRSQRIAELGCLLAIVVAPYVWIVLHSPGLVSHSGLVDAPLQEPLVKLVLQNPDQPTESIAIGFGLDCPGFADVVDGIVLTFGYESIAIGRFKGAAGVNLAMRSVNPDPNNPGESVLSMGANKDTYLSLVDSDASIEAGTGNAEAAIRLLFGNNASACLVSSGQGSEVEIARNGVSGGVADLEVGDSGIRLGLLRWADTGGPESLFLWVTGLLSKVAGENQQDVPLIK